MFLSRNWLRGLSLGDSDQPLHRLVNQQTIKHRPLPLVGIEGRAHIVGPGTPQGTDPFDVRADIFLVHLDPFPAYDLSHHQGTLEPRRSTGLQFLLQFLQCLTLQAQIILQREPQFAPRRLLDLLDCLVQCLFEHHRRIFDLRLLKDVLQHLRRVLLIGFLLRCPTQLFLDVLLQFLERVKVADGTRQIVVQLGERALVDFCHPDGELCFLAL